MLDVACFTIGNGHFSRGGQGSYLQISKNRSKIKISLLKDATSLISILKRDHRCTFAKIDKYEPPLHYKAYLCFDKINIAND